MSSEQAISAAFISPVHPARRRRKRWRDVSWLGIGVSLFLIAYYIGIFVIPFWRAIKLSFQNWDFIVDPIYVGTRNYDHTLHDRYFWQAVRVTVFFSFFEILIGMVLAFLVALGISQLGSRMQRMYLGLFYLPVVVPSIVTILLWRWLYSPTGGVINNLLVRFGLPEQPFLNSPSQALWCVIVMVVWANLGGATIILFAGISEIPIELYEAAKIDGATLLRQTKDITLPLLRPIIFFQIVVSVIGTVQMFEQFLLLSGPGFSTRTLVLYIYELGFKTLNLGYGAAVSILVFFMLLIATALQFLRYLRTQE